MMSFDLSPEANVADKLALKNLRCQKFEARGPESGAIVGRLGPQVLMRSCVQVRSARTYGR